VIISPLSSQTIDRQSSHAQTIGLRKWKLIRAIRLTELLFFRTDYSTNLR